MDIHIYLIQRYRQPHLTNHSSLMLQAIGSRTIIFFSFCLVIFCAAYSRRSFVWSVCQLFCLLPICWQVCKDNVATFVQDERDSWLPRTTSSRKLLKDLKGNVSGFFTVKGEHEWIFLQLQVNISWFFKVTWEYKQIFYS